MRSKRSKQFLIWVLAVMLGMTTAFTGDVVYGAEEQEDVNPDQVVEESADSWRYENGELKDVTMDQNAVMGNSIEEDEDSLEAAADSGYGMTQDKKWVFKYAGKKVTCTGGYLKGIDVSVWQNRSLSNRYINWKKVKKAVDKGKLDFVIIRCGYNVNKKEYDDSEFEYNVKACEKKKIPYGVYLYSYAKNEDDAKSEAKHALRLLKGHYPKYPVYYDLEDYSILSATGKSKSKVTKFAKIFCSRLANNGYKSGVYANLTWFSKYIDGPALKESGYDLWLAQWARSSQSYSGGSNYSIWQCSSWGKVSGIRGRVDVDLLVKKYSVMKKYMKDISLPSTLKVEASEMSESEIKYGSVRSRKGPGPGWRPSKKYEAGTHVGVLEKANGYYHLDTGDWVTSDSIYKPTDPKEFDGTTFTAYNGEMITSSWVKFEGSIYYATETGAIVKSQVLKIGRYRYGFDATGAMCKGVTKWFGNQKYKFDNEGYAIQKKAVINKKVTCRSGPGKDYYYKGKVKKGKTVFIIRKSGDWSQMTDGYWVPTSKTTAKLMYPIYRPEVKVNMQAMLNETYTSKSGPKTSYLDVKTYQEGATVTITGTYGKWAQLSGGDWVPLKKLTILE